MSHEKFVIWSWIPPKSLLKCPILVILLHEGEFVLFGSFMRTKIGLVVQWGTCDFDFGNEDNWWALDIWEHGVLNTSDFALMLSAVMIIEPRFLVSIHQLILRVIFGYPGPRGIYEVHIISIICSRLRTHQPANATDCPYTDILNLMR